MIILIDGPEKAGKTTLANELQRQTGAAIRHWGPVYPDDRVYLPALIDDCASSNIVIWDRGWASEHVYANLLHRDDRRLRHNPLLGEWLYGRAVQTIGVRVMLLPGSGTVAPRDSTDLPVDPKIERARFYKYAVMFGWSVLFNNYLPWEVQANATIILHKLENMGPLRPPVYCGPQDAKIVFVGESPSNSHRSGIPGSWLPFTSRLTMKLMEEMGPNALKFGWTNVSGIPLGVLENKITVACGKEAERRLENLPGVRCSIPHPSWLYRYTNQNTLIKRQLVTLLLKSLNGV